MAGTQPLLTGAWHARRRRADPGRYGVQSPRGAEVLPPLLRGDPDRQRILAALPNVEAPRLVKVRALPAAPPGQSQ
jgi:hypothetical protein